VDENAHDWGFPCGRELLDELVLVASKNNRLAIMPLCLIPKIDR
jgi:hypothetical protein